VTVAAVLAATYVPGSGVSGSLAVTLSPTTLSQTGTTSMITTAGCAATATGGTAPYTYEWFADPENTDSIQPTTPNSATTAFKRLSCISGETYSGFFFCTVTDALGSKATTATEVSVSIARS
jgi:hypothetical protein